MLTKFEFFETQLGLGPTVTIENQGLYTITEWLIIGDSISNLTKVWP